MHGTHAHRRQSDGTLVGKSERASEQYQMCSTKSKIVIIKKQNKKQNKNQHQNQKQKSKNKQKPTYAT